MHGLASPNELKDKAAAISKKTGTAVETADADLRDPSAIRDMVGDVAARHGRLDILVNNAGVQFVAPVEEFPEEKWDMVIGEGLQMKKCHLPIHA
jgi:3-hydroxybutyrate dehydrogenase